MPTPTQIPPKKPEPSTIQVVASRAQGIAKASKIAQKIFTPGLQSQTSPVEIRDMLRLLGADIPKEVNISVAAAQMMVAGGAFYSAVDKANSVQQIIKPTAGLLNSVTSLLGELGLFDKGSFGAKWLDIGTSVVVLLAVPGVNILAAIGLAAKVILEFIFPPDERPEVRARLERQSAQELQAWYKQEIDRQKKSIILNQIALADGKVSPFQMLANVATQSPILFPYFVPELNAFLPPQNFSQCIEKQAEAKHGGFLGLFRQTEIVKTRVCAEYQAVKVSGKMQLAEAFIRAYLYEPYAPYFLIENMPESVLAMGYGYPEGARKIGVQNHRNPIYPRIPVSDLALLSMFPPYFGRIEDDFDITDFLNRLTLTPRDLGYEHLLERELGYQGYFGEIKTEKLPAITFNGVDYFDPQSRSYNAKVSSDNLSIKRAWEADQAGDHKALYNNWAAVEIIKEWGVMPYATPEMSKMIPGLTIKNPALQKVDYRNIQNVWACYSMINTMRQDPFFQDCLTAFSFLGRLVQDAERVESRYTEIYNLMLAKELNRQSRKRIAGFFGAPVEGVEFRNNPDGTAFVTLKK